MKSIDQYDMVRGQRVYDAEETDALLNERSKDYKQVATERDMYRRYYDAVSVAKITQTNAAEDEVRRCVREIIEMREAK